MVWTLAHLAFSRVVSRRRVGHHPGRCAGLLERPAGDAPGGSTGHVLAAWRRVATRPRGSHPAPHVPVGRTRRGDVRCGAAARRGAAAVGGGEPDDLGLAGAQNSVDLRHARFARPRRRRRPLRAG
eukprot:scaffold2283_cov104-Isochrysis_galbana.AAC.7